jgi:hypothetical protein
MLQARVGQAAYASAGSLKKLTQLCILNKKKFFFDLVCAQNDDEINPFSKICK